MEKTKEHYYKLLNKYGRSASINARYVVQPKINEKFSMVNCRFHSINFSLKDEISIKLMEERERERDFICWGGSPEFFEYLKKINNKNK